MQTLIKLVNRVKLALWKRSVVARNALEFYTPVEAFVSAGCIGPIGADLWHAHALAREVYPMPKAGTHHVSPNFSYPN